MRKLKFFLIGLIPGLLLVFFILNKKGASCSGYLPNSRVIAETLSKEMVYSPAFSASMKDHKFDEKFLKDSITNESYEGLLYIPKLDNPKDLEKKIQFISK
mgnify:CR=1 FL=1